MKRIFFVFNFKEDDKAKIADYLLCFFSVLGIFFLFFYFIESVVVEMPKHRVAFEWEKYIPFFPFAFIPYYGIFILPLFIPFAIKRKKKLYTLALRLIFSIIIAGIIFLIFPCELIFGKRNLPNQFEYFTTFITGKYNLVPSLHVCLTYIICLSLFNEYNGPGKLLIIITLIVLPLSTLFSHQHHVVDVLSGLILATISFKLIRHL
jgi:hypothetical protein